MRAVILAAGQGTRLGELTADTPKCLVEILGKSILEWQLHLLNQTGIDEISIVIGTKGRCWTQENYEKIRKICPNIVYNFDNTSTQNSYSMYLALKDSTSKDIIFIDGDVIFGMDVLKQLIDAREGAAVLSCSANDRSDPGNRIVTDGENRVIDIGKNILPEMFPWYIYGGVGMIKGSMVNTLCDILSIYGLSEEDLGSPLKRFAREHELINLSIEKGWVNVNTIADLQAAEKIVRDLD